MGNLSVLIPAFNEQTTIAAIIQSLQKIQGISEILVINDGSSDQTAHVAQQAGARVVSHRRSRGNGAAVKTGLLEAKSEWVIIMDADGQHTVSDVQKLMSFPEDVLLAVGARSFRWYRFRDIGNLLLRSFATLMSGTKIEDLTSGLRRIHRPTALSFWHIYPEGYSFPSTSTILFASAGFPVEFFPIENLARPAHASSSKLHPFREGVRFLTIIYRVTLLGYPMRFFAPTGLSLILFGSYWVFRTVSRSGQVSPAGVLFFLAGLTILLFGTVITGVGCRIAVARNRQRPGRGRRDCGGDCDRRVLRACFDIGEQAGIDCGGAGIKVWIDQIIGAAADLSKRR